MIKKIHLARDRAYSIVVLIIDRYVSRMSSLKTCVASFLIYLHNYQSYGNRTTNISLEICNEQCVIMIKN